MTMSPADTPTAGKSCRSDVTVAGRFARSMASDSDTIEAYCRDPECMPDVLFIDLVRRGASTSPVMCSGVRCECCRYRVGTPGEAKGRDARFCLHWWSLRLRRRLGWSVSAGWPSVDGHEDGVGISVGVGRPIDPGQ